MVDAPLYQRKKGGIKSVGFLEFTSILTEEEITRIDQLAENETEDLAKVQASDQLLKSLKPGQRGAAEQVGIQTCSPGLLEASSMRMSYFVRATSSSAFDTDESLTQMSIFK